MLAVISSRLLLLRDFLPARKFLNEHRICWLPSSVCFLHRVPLTLESIGLSEFDPNRWRRRDEKRNSTADGPIGKDVIAKESLEIEAAPSGAKSLPEIGVKRESNTLSSKRMSGRQKLDSAVDVPIDKMEKVVRSKSMRDVTARESLEIEAAPFAVKSVSEIGVKRESDTPSSKRMGERRKLDSSVNVSDYRVKKVDRAVKAKKPLEIEAAPFAAKTFSELGLSLLLIERLEKEGFTIPTEVQSTAIPMILKDHDVVIQSYTGSGKTLAYLLPILSEMAPFGSTTPGSDEPKPGKNKDIEAVIVAPSRELGMQIVKEFEKLLGPAEKRRVQQLVGGANKRRQEEALKKNKPSIVVGSVGRIAEICRAGKLNTRSTRYLVLDEVDELLSANFHMDIQWILEHVGIVKSAAGPNSSKGTITKEAERQVIMLSATVPFSVVRAGQSWARDPLLVRANSVAPLESAIPRPVVSGLMSNSGSQSNFQSPVAIESLPPNLKHYYCVARIQRKLDALRRCIHALDAQFVIAFMNQSKFLKDIVKKLKARGMEAAELHGDLSKLDRSTNLKKFKDGEVRVLVTNELSARGLDVVECDLIVNLELPADSIHYAHRAGRTGRLGRKGNVVTICDEGEVLALKKLQRQLGFPINACEFTEGQLILTKEDELEGESLEAVSS